MDFPNPGPYSPPEASKSAKTQSSPLACDGLILAILSGENTSVNLSASCRSNEEISVNRSSKLAEMGGAEHGHGHGAEDFRTRVWSMSVVHTAGPSTGVATPMLMPYMVLPILVSRIASSRFCANAPLKNSSFCGNHTTRSDGQWIPCPFLINENILGKCFRSCTSFINPRISPLTMKYKCPRLAFRPSWIGWHVMWRNLARFAASSFRRRLRLFSTAIPGACIIHKRGADILHDPWFNKHTGFPLLERDRVGLRGLLPPRVISFEQQYVRFNTPSYADVGTNNQKLLEDRLYLGVRQPRLEGEEYLSIVDEFMEAVFKRWPKAIIQFEDFQMKWAFETLKRYQKRFCMFNDDIQGTADVALAGLLGTVRAQGQPLADFVNQKIVVVGAEAFFFISFSFVASSAGLGVLNMAVLAVSNMTGNNETAARYFFLIDKDVSFSAYKPQQSFLSPLHTLLYGLITKERKNIDPAAAPFAKDPVETMGLGEGAMLLEVVKKVKPHVLLGLSGVGGIFSEEVLKAMHESDSKKPAIFAMSNPTLNAECTAADAFRHAGENIIFASGSPFQNVDLGNGKVGHVNQANNMYLFPGIGLGALLSGARFITDGMLQAAAECLASYMTDEEIQKGILYPSIDSIRHITAEVGAAVLRAAVSEELAEGHGDVGAKELMQMSKENICHLKESQISPQMCKQNGENILLLTQS
ncbi:hypothetical protein SLEP1_g2499 [Rubroshorea leprosula]|uniref:Malic enzyme n=1 Tax=Rubroshorea leprosula TaxID=152421 RepID=A0AAV5HSS2_9ROSI|nr:hypothetical protein SLEP1_g2499 [Rubroshorea leprosula]